MTNIQIDSIGQTSQIIGLIAKRQKLLGTNIANVDTPGYVRKDMDFAQCLGNSSGTMETRLSSAMGSSAVAEERYGEEVNAAQELVEMQENSLLYTMATRRMSNIITQMKTVLNVGK